jgi:hypothetical protein
MKTWVRKTLSVGVLAAGALLFAPGAAHAGVSQDTAGNNGVANGIQFVAPFNVPMNTVGNAIGVAGEANAAGSVINRTEGGWAVSQTSAYNNGVLNGLQGYFPVNIPINNVGNADAILGHANAAGSAVNGHGRKESGHVDGHGGPVQQDTWGNNGILNGTQIYAPVEIPINICGNSSSLLGEANSQAFCANNDRGGFKGGRSVKQNSWGNNGILNGTQIYAPFTMPVNLAGNSDAFLGHANSAAVAHNESAESARSHGVDQNTWGNNGIGNGLQIVAPTHIPVNMCGNALGILGHANAAASCANIDGDFGHGGHGHGQHGTKGHGHDHDGNAGDNGDGDYAGDNGNAGDDGDQDGQYMGDHGAQGNGGANGYGSKTDGRMGKSAAEASPVDSLSQGVSDSGLGGLDLLNTLR